MKEGRVIPASYCLRLSSEDTEGRVDRVRTEDAMVRVRRTEVRVKMERTE